MITIIGNIIFLLIGVIVGYFLNIRRIEKTIEQAKTTYSAMHEQAGIIKRPTAQYLREKNTIVGETKQAMREQLQSDPYLHENKS